MSNVFRKWARESGTWRRDGPAPILVEQARAGFRPTKAVRAEAKRTGVVELPTGTLAVPQAAKPEEAKKRASRLVALARKILGR